MTDETAPRGARYGEPIRKRPEDEAKLEIYPLADISAEPPGIVTPDDVRAELDIAKIVADTMHSCSRCGARLGRSGKCPALCEPIPENPPKYTGPERVGRTHLGRLGAPVI